MDRKTLLAIAAGLIAATTNAPGAALAKADPPPLRFAFEEVVNLGPDENAGRGLKGERNRIALLGGSVTGERLTGDVVAGGADWQLIRSDGCAEILADYFIRAQDGALIHVINRGLGCAPDARRGLYLRANPVFDAPVGPHDWLNRSVFTSTIEELPDEAGRPRQVRIRFYEVE